MDRRDRTPSRDERSRLRRDYPGAVTDPDEIQRIRDRRAYADLPAWKRITKRTPKGWR